MRVTTLIPEQKYFRNWVSLLRKLPRLDNVEWHVNGKHSLGNRKYSLLSEKTITERNISTADCVAAGICGNTQRRTNHITNKDFCRAHLYNTRYNRRISSPSEGKRTRGRPVRRWRDALDEYERTLHDRGESKTGRSGNNW